MTATKRKSPLVWRTEMYAARKKDPTRAELLTLYERVKSYCKRERRDVDVGSPEMVEDWHRICRSVGVNPKPRW